MIKFLKRMVMLFELVFVLVILSPGILWGIHDAKKRAKKSK